MDRPKTSVILAMSADGKIGDAYRNHAKFGSRADYLHLEERVADADAVLFGAGTLRAGGSAMRVQRQSLIDERLTQGKPAQPIQIVCTRTGRIDPNIMFFRQPIPRWMVTTPEGAQGWGQSEHFDTIIAETAHDGEIHWPSFLSHCHSAGIQHLAVLGGGEVVSALIKANLIDELWLTLCPLILGGRNAPSPADGLGVSQELAPRLKLLSCEQVEDELFLHYQVIHQTR